MSFDRAQGKARHPRCAICKNVHYTYTREATWRDLKRLAGKVRRSKAYQKRQIKNIYGIPSGGLIPAWVLGGLLNLPLIFDKAGIGPHTLVVDDIADSGKTLIILKPFHVAVLWYRPATCLIPCDELFWERLKSERLGWIEFFWETRKTTHLSVHKET
ncbi:MAG: hypothetical protein A2806_00365 [Candidatus Terrybacteria bacterium RIFCSPHIGHO2_01_FULL_48_17]|uniref:Phosphoribosyltransferase domain-containing protein n=1 Tax=Candidatus Terrybacteria bacterium RIFCSPHIGHO2_01_FULL_48_17 TaxID=1802362 RepID=A0A1G2PLG3_9BACT|nr:MAG: hypothetical protein A2806_00365 [Candidatus Terrybacteria bacterium RIFCSPHIGHO2_01_FULL_48_17]OHA53668.1 MAG: hypothetical protein A3A30_00685 [Candidatus Terrybacteria bacterium RIFCSPLOWO2_01_FULL_48_14]